MSEPEVTEEEIEQLTQWYGNKYSQDNIKKLFTKSRQDKLSMAKAMVLHQNEVICAKNYQGHVKLEPMFELYYNLEAWQNYVVGYSTSIEHKMHNNNMILSHQAKQWFKLYFDKDDTSIATKQWKRKVLKYFGKVGKQHGDCDNFQQLFFSMYTELYHYIYLSARII